MRSVGGAARVVEHPLPHFALSEVPKAARLYDAETVRTKAFYRGRARFTGVGSLLKAEAATTW